MTDGIFPGLGVHCLNAQFDTTQIKEFHKKSGCVKVWENKDHNLRHENTLVVAVVSGKITARPNDTPIKNTISTWVGHMHSLLPKYIIRRMIRSKGPGGQLISKSSSTTKWSCCAPSMRTRWRSSMRSHPTWWMRTYSPRRS